MASACPRSTRKSSCPASWWYIDIGCPGRSQCRPMPRSSKCASPWPPNRHIVRMSLCIHGASRALTTNQPAVCGTPPCTRASAICASSRRSYALGMDSEQEVADLWDALDQLDEAEFRARIDRLADRLPPARAAFERACAFDSTGHPDRAVPLYREALEGGLEGLNRRRAVIQLSSSLRN